MVPMARPVRPQPSTTQKKQWRDARAVDYAGEDVAAEFVGAHPVGDGRRFEAAGKILAEWICWGHQRRENCDEQEECSGGETDTGQEALPKKLFDIGGSAHETRTRGSTKE